MSSRGVKDLREWDGTMRRVRAGLYVTYYPTGDEALGDQDWSDVTVYRFNEPGQPPYWQWNLYVLNTEQGCVGDGEEYGTMRAAVQAAWSYVHDGVGDVAPLGERLLSASG